MLVLYIRFVREKKKIRPLNVMSERLGIAALVWFVLLIYKGLRGLKKKSAYTLTTSYYLLQILPSWFFQFFK